MTEPRLLVVSLNYRTPDMTLRSVRAALKALDGLTAELVVVDNDSGDGSFEMLSTQIAAWNDPRVRLIRSGHNGGFGAGNNIGIRAGLSDGSKPDFVYILNSDAFPEKPAIRALLDHLLAHPRAGFAGSRIKGEDGAPHLTAFRFPSVWSELEGAARLGPISRALRRHIVALDLPTASGPVDWLAGASLMMRQDMLDRIGLFDETFFLYFEETDLCRRGFLAGFETHFVCESHVVHIGSVSTGMKTWRRIPGFWLDSRWHYFTKNHGRAYAAAATVLHGVGGLIWRIRRLVQSRPMADPPHFLRDLLLHDLRALFRPLPGKRTAGPSCQTRTAAKTKAEHP